MIPRVINAAVLLAFLSLATPASAQVLTGLGLGAYRDDAGTQVVAEAWLATMIGPILPNLLLTFNLEGSGMPVVQPQIGRTIAATAAGTALILDIGASAGPNDYTKWEPHFSVTTLAYLLGPVKVSATFSWQPWASWARSYVVKLDTVL
jgi:hypothetical protein